MTTEDPCADSLDPLCGSSFSPYSLEALVATFVAWVVALAVMWILFVLIWPWEGRLRRRCDVISSLWHSEPDQPGLFVNRPLVAEKLMLLAYLYFWVTSAVGVALTRWSGLDLSRTVLKRVFSYNNICVFYDTAPASYALPFLFAVTLVFLLGWQGLHVLVMGEQLSKHGISPLAHRLLCSAHCFTSLSFIFFCTSFAVNPALETVDPDHIALILHSVPFLLLQWGLFAMLATFAFYAQVTSYWQSLGLPRAADSAGWVYCAVVFFVVLLKEVHQCSALLQSSVFGEDPTFPQLLDVLFLLLVAILPAVICLLLLTFKYDYLRKAQIRIAHIEPCSPPSTILVSQLDPISPMQSVRLQRSDDSRPPAPVAAWTQGTIPHIE